MAQNEVMCKQRKTRKIKKMNTIITKTYQCCGETEIYSSNNFEIKDGFTYECSRAKHIPFN